MNRTHLKSLVLLNWKGLFYHRFELHDRVTALEGQNGAGKTTVMIAAYVALMPDQSKLRFTNLGEHSATGGDRGIYGRLGEMGRPTYSVLEVGLPDGIRLLCGVQLQRKSAPSVELHPFVITGVSAAVSLSDLLLDRSNVGGTPIDAIPEMEGIRQNAARLGGRLEAFGSAKEYFAKLFDYGVTPIRLVNEDERDKFNEVLRTSMVGGISRALGAELRSFLLKEEAGLADSLKQMRSNLDACRKTRSEVKEAQQIESQIQSVLEAGQEMFAAAIHAGRTRVSDLRKVWEEARLNYDQGEAKLRELQAQVDRCQEEYQQIEQEYDAKQTQKERLTDEVARLGKRCELDKRISEQQIELAKHTTAAAEAKRLHDLAKSEHDRCVLRRQQAEDAVDRATEGLADLKKGLEELALRAAAYARATEADERVQQAHAPPPVHRDQFAELERTVQQQLDSLDQEIVRIERLRAGATRHAEEYKRTALALSVLCAEFPGEETGTLASGDRYQQAQRMLSRLRELAAQGAELPQLREALTTAKQRADEQRRVFDEASALATTEQSLARSDDVFAFKERIDAQRADHSNRLGDLEAEHRVLAQRLETEGSRRKELEDELRRYHEVQVIVRQLSVEWQRPLLNSADLDALRIELSERSVVLQRQVDGVAQQQDAIAEELWRMEQSGCLPETVRAACQRVDGELLLERFDDISVEDAGRVEAQLGPLYEAILVDDVDAAVSVLTKLEAKHRPDTVWLMERETDLQSLIAARPLSDQDRDVLVRDATGHRLTRIPSRPVLGSRARRQRAGELRSQEHRLNEQLAELRGQAEELKRGIEQCTHLLRQSSILDQNDPSVALAQVEQSIAEAQEALPVLRNRINEHEEKIRELSKTAAKLSTLCRRAHLLDLPNQRQEAERLHQQILHAEQMDLKLRQFSAQRQLVEYELEVLRTEPPSPSELGELETARQRHEKERDAKQRLRDDLRLLLSNMAALDWSDAAETLKRQTVENESLRAQHEQAKKERDAARERERIVYDCVQDASKNDLQAASRVVHIEDRLHSLLAELAEVAGMERTPSEAERSLQMHQAQLQEVLLHLPGLENRKKSLRDEVVKIQERTSIQKESLSGLQEKVGQAERAAKPEQERCERIERRAEESGVLHAALAARYQSKFSAQGQVNLWTLYKEQRGVLRERLKLLREGAELARQMDDSGSEQSSGESALDAWLRVRSFLLRCIPAQIAEADDPEVALGRLGNHLRRLALKLSQQEDRLRGDSQDIAHNIDGLVRKARKQITRLNQDLKMVRFGSIASVRIKVLPVERMDRILRALKDGVVQALLFQSEMPLEEALEEIFRSYGGGRAGGHKLLDYREYLELVVEIQRQVAPDWEPVNATKMSTGEAIGVGAAVMMVILTAWERDANLLRTKRSAGTLRLLFLDEATRLSRDSLDVLFDLCEGLELQLIIAAPEIANAEGNITHHLVRAVEQGREEVRVSARRVIPRPDDGAAVHVA